MNKNAIAVAILNASAENAPVGIAMLAATAVDDGWYQLLPAGRFRSRDGRPEDVPDGWLMNAGIAARLIAGVRALGQDVLIDYEHNQLRKMQKDVALPPESLAAAGWFNADEMQWRENEGLFIKPRWTPAARLRIDNGEFGYLSAVFPYAANGEPTALRMAALTNDPGATGMKRLAALAAKFPDNSPQQESLPMNEKLRQLLARLGITVPEKAEITDEQATAALSAFDVIKANAGKVAALSAELETARTASAGAVDLTKYVPVEAYNAVRKQLAEVSGQHSTATLSAVLDKAEQEGRIFKCERGYFEQLGGQIGVAALSAQFDQKQPIAALSAMQTVTTPGVEQSQKERLAALSADEKAAAKALGITDAEYQKLKEDEKA